MPSPSPNNGRWKTNVDTCPLLNFSEWYIIRRSIIIERAARPRGAQTKRKKTSQPRSVYTSVRATVLHSKPYTGGIHYGQYYNDTHSYSYSCTNFSRGTSCPVFSEIRTFIFHDVRYDGSHGPEVLYNIVYSFNLLFFIFFFKINSRWRDREHAVVCIIQWTLQPLRIQCIQYYVQYAAVHCKKL